MNILKKVLSILSLSIGGFCVAAPIQMALQIFFSSPAPTGRLAGGTIVLLWLFAPVGILFILLGLYLWDWRRRRIVFGIVSTAVGGWFVLVTIAFTLASINSMMSRGGPIATSVLALIFLSVGISLIIRQKKIDQSNIRS